MWTSTSKLIDSTAFTPLVFSTTGGRLAQLVAAKKGEIYANTMLWIKARIFFALLRSALHCLRGSRASSKVHFEFLDYDLDIDKGHANIC